MKLSKLFTKTKKESKEYDSKNATLLTKGGFIYQIMAGAYAYLPLGLRVLNKIESIVREEMDKISHEVLLTAIAPREIWQKTNRDGIDVLFEVRGANDSSRAQNDSSYILNPTHEDNITPIVQSFSQSYRDFPIALYQIQNKFRNEARPKSGILRGREFRMKDLYSFHTSKEDFEKYYEVAKQSYINVFERLGIGDKTVVALASGGDFTENYSHEFQTKCEAGEDVIFYDEVDNIYYNREVTPSIAPSVKQDETKKIREDVYGENIVSVEKLVEFLKVEITRTIKTILYIADEKLIAAAVRGDYEIDEGKLKKVLGAKSLRLLTDEEIEKHTGAKVGYAGIVNLPENIQMICDNALEEMINFEVGVNKTNYHAVNGNWGIDVKKPDKFYDIKVAKIGDINPKNNKPYSTFKSAEVGNIFPLESKFPDALGFTATSENGESGKIYMGSYGIGTTRVMGVIAEIMNDEKGLIWPEQIAPFKVHLITLYSKASAEHTVDDDVFFESNKLYEELNAKGIEVLWDDRLEVRPGEKFADADLIGNPIRVVISQRTLEQDSVEVKYRNSDTVELVKIDRILEILK